MLYVVVFLVSVISNSTLFILYSLLYYYLLILIFHLFLLSICFIMPLSILPLFLTRYNVEFITLTTLLEKDRSIKKL